MATKTVYDLVEKIENVAFAMRCQGGGQMEYLELERVLGESRGSVNLKLAIAYCEGSGLISIVNVGKGNGRNIVKFMD